MENLHWVACWGNATSYTDRREAVYAKDITLRYPVRMCFSGNQLRFHLSNLTGTEPVEITRMFVNQSPVTLAGEVCMSIPAGEEILTDPVSLSVEAGEVVNVSFYLGTYTQMNAGTLITGPLSEGFYSYGDHALDAELPMDLTRKTNWFYFLNTIDIYTSQDNHAVICYGDSITAQSWPDYLTLVLEQRGVRNLSVIRRAVSGSRILRQYDCIAYQAYGLKGATRFPVESQVAGATDLIIQHGINDIIHPVGVETNPFRPWSDMPTLDELKQGVQALYIRSALAQGLRVYLGTLLPIEGWRTYNTERDELRMAFNEWMRTQPADVYGVMDFDLAVRDAARPSVFAPGFDSGDHLHPSEKAYAAMAECACTALLSC